ncbi:hypothetical protein AKJ09_09355 [Labilithrix luteola]|uniref:Tryptophan synthase alpha chain n=1 Tax=Labilithrix luteola TaxID=1391654 RepID=A0A0K1QAI5_9BACT|nr:hypothetical protein [Labilithrix luteola]AKV02692.1 hypothetical protein AKJ09_09355 [Labilithrix luteola]
MISAASAFVGFACAEDSNLVSLGPSASSDGGGAFFVPDARGDAAADASSSAKAEMCVSTTCPSPYATCPSQDFSGQLLLPTYACGTNLANDVHNCGACGNDCGDLGGSLNVQTSCVNGACRADCYNLDLDCNGILDDGCEANPKSDPANCGGCGQKCAPGVACIDGRCGCPTGLVDCNGTCVDLQTNDDNCGACDFNCDDHPPEDAGAPPDHMRFGCIAGECKTLHCDRRAQVLWENCNGLLDDGCEIDLGTDDRNCGKCGTECPVGKHCFDDYANPGVACQCPASRTICGSTCVDLETDPGNCGSCNFFCPDPVAIGPNQYNGRTSCDHGRCGYECFPGFADCNGRLDDGCETELAKDPTNCGACGVTCNNAVGQPCVNGQCVTEECDAGKVPQ